jgi:GT2 family glycosyltransferase
MIPTFNRTQYLTQTLESVLVQAPPPEQMQILVVDNCSDKGDIAGLVERIGHGRIDFVRNDCNLGMIGNLNACIDHARGHFVHLLHDDDYVMPGFYRAIQNQLEANPTADMALVRHAIIDRNGTTKRFSAPLATEPGLLPEFRWRIGVKQLVQFAAIVVRREAYRSVGGFTPELEYACDWEMWARLGKQGSLLYVPEVLACYREHDASETSRLSRAAGTIRDAARAIDVMHADHASLAYLTARKNLGRDSLKRAALFAKAGQREVALRHVVEAIRLGARIPSIWVGAAQQTLAIAMVNRSAA